MVDRLIGVGGEFAAGQAESLVEVDCGAEGEDACGDAGEQTGGGAAAVAFEQQLVFEAVDDRLDSLPDPARRWVPPVGLVGAAGSQEQRAQLADGGLEVGAGEAFVADDRGALDRVGFEQGERRLALAAVGGRRGRSRRSCRRGRRAARA